MSTKIKFEDYLETLEWENRDREYWRGVFKDSDGIFRYDWGLSTKEIIQWDHEPVIEEYLFDVCNTMRNSWPYYVENWDKAGKARTSRAESYSDLIRRIRYVKRGNNPQIMKKCEKTLDLIYRWL